MNDQIYVDRKLLQECLDNFLEVQRLFCEIFEIKPDAELMKDSLITRLKECLTK